MFVFESIVFLLGIFLLLTRFVLLLFPRKSLHGHNLYVYNRFQLWTLYILASMVVDPALIAIVCTHHNIFFQHGCSTRDGILRFRFHFKLTAQFSVGFSLPRFCYANDKTD